MYSSTYDSNSELRFEKKKFKMDKLIAYKILIGLLICSLIVTIVCFVNLQKCDTPPDNLETAALLGLDWYCETVLETPCKYPSTLSLVGRKDYVYKGKTQWNCTDRNRQVSGTYDVGRMTITNDAVFGVYKCMDLNYRPQDPDTPCIIDFQICLEDPHVPAMTLKCKYLKDLKHFGNQYLSPGNQSATCNADGTVHTYYMNTGHSTWRIDFNNEKLRIETAILPDTKESNRSALAI